MKLFFTTLCFFAFITILPAQWFFSSLGLSPTDSIRVDSVIKEIDYWFETDQFLPLSQEEAGAKAIEDVRAVIPKDKIERFDGLFQTTSATSPDSIKSTWYILTSEQSDKLLEFQQLQRADGDIKSVAEEKMESEAFEYTLLTPEQKILYPAHKKKKREYEVSRLQSTIQALSPGFDLSESQAETLLTMVEQETSDYLTAIEIQSEEQRFTLYRTRLKLIISQEKLKQFDRAFEHRESIKHRIALQNDSIAYAAKLQQLVAFSKWWSENLETAYKQLQKQYTAVIPVSLMPELDSIRKFEEEYFIAVFNQMSFRNKEQKPLYFEFTLLKKKQMLIFPNLRQTIDATGSTQDFNYGFNPDFIKYRKEIIASIDPEVYKNLSVELLHLEKMQQDFMQYSAPDLFPEWFPDTPASVAAQNRILNFLLSMPDK